MRLLLPSRQDPSSLEKHQLSQTSPHSKSKSAHSSGFHRNSDLGSGNVMEYNTERGIEGDRDQQRSAWQSQQRTSDARHSSREPAASTSTSTTSQPPYSNQHQYQQQYPRESQPLTMPPTAAGPIYHPQHASHSQHLPHQGESSYFSVPPGPHSQQYAGGHGHSHAPPPGQGGPQGQATGLYTHAYPTQQQSSMFPSAESQGPPTLPQQQQQHQQQHQQQQGLYAPQIPNPYPNNALPPNTYPQTLMRPPNERPIVKVTIDLLDTYKTINERYYQERERRRQIAAAQQRQRALDEQQQAQQQIQPEDDANLTRGPGVHNNGYDDTDYDYILTSGELFNNRYKILERIGKGSFGQVVSATDIVTNTNVAIKIIKSKKPFQLQARTEIELLTHLRERDREDQHNIVRLLTHFMYKNHQCLVFEMLSMNLYDLLKNTKFTGVSLNLIRKFAKQILKALQFLSQPDVDVIHCDLKPENILLRHPKRSGVKVIDFGSSCKSNKRMYFYIQSRFYRSPEVILGLPYSVSIDMWSLGCILVEMHTGEPLFSGTDQVDQMQKIVKVLGMIPVDVLNQVDEKHKVKFFERPSILSREWVIKRKDKQQERIVPSSDPISSLRDILQTEERKKKANEKGGGSSSGVNYDMFVDLIYRMLTYDPLERISPDEAMQHPFIVANEHSLSRQASNGTSALSSRRY